MRYYDTSRNRIMSEYDLRSFGIYNEKSALRLGIYPLKQEVSSYDPDTQKSIATGYPELVDGVCIQRYETVDFDEEEMEQSMKSVSERVLREIRNRSDKTLQPFLQDYSETEKMTFDLQAQEVYNYKTSPETAKTPIIDGLAKARGISREELIKKAESKIDIFHLVSTSVIGTQQKYEDMVKDILQGENTPKEKIQALKSINVEYTIPVQY